MRGRRPFSKLAPLIAAGAARGLYKGGTEIINDSERLVPVETGVLRASGRVFEPELDGDTITVRAGFGYGAEYSEKVHADDPDETTGYAVYVHEDLTKRHDPPTQAKFLEQPALEHAPQLGPTIAVEIRKSLRGEREL